MRVSVVVPVYNPGMSLRRCVNSLLAQSLPAESMELIFVDDGSSDGSGEVLDGLATRHGHVRVIHQPNSGWSGRPRNVGIEAATGEFVQFVDQDDVLAPEALERLTAFGADHRADIVIGKVTSDFRRVPHELFRRNIPRCSIRDEQLIRSLTPHKMFRRSFLLDKHLRYAEGRVRLEDQLFMTQAYFATDAVAILADYPCYFYLRREDRGNSAKPNYDPAIYYRYVREVLDVIAEHTHPGEFRDSLHDRFLNSMLQKVTAAAPKSKSEDRLIALMNEITSVVRAYFDLQIVERAPLLRRQLAEAILSGRPRRVRAAVRRSRDVVGRIDSVTVAPSGRGGWTLSARASLAFPDGEPIVFHPERDRWRPDERLAITDRDIGAMKLEELLERASGEVVLRCAETGVEWLAATSLDGNLEPVGSEDGHQLQVSGTVEIVPETFAAGAPLSPGTWFVSVRAAALGVGRATAVRRWNTHLVGRRTRRRRAPSQLRFIRRRLAVVVPD